MKTLDWSVETLGLDYNSTALGFVIIYLNQSSERNMIDIPGTRSTIGSNILFNRIWEENERKH